MSYHTHNLEPGDRFYDPAEIFEDGYWEDETKWSNQSHLVYEKWECISCERAPEPNPYGRVHVVAKCLTDPAKNLDVVCDGDISLCMIEP
jgi:hypothetical protein